MAGIVVSFFVAQSLRTIEFPFSLQMLYNPIVSIPLVDRYSTGTEKKIAMPVEERRKRSFLPVWLCRFLIESRSRSFLLKSIPGNNISPSRDLAADRLYRSKERKRGREE